MASLSDWFKLGLAKPSGTDYEEHSAVGDVSTGRKFKAVQNVPNYVAIDSTISTLVYIGETNPGTNATLPNWRIRQVLTTNSITTISFASGNDQFVNIWANRASLTYL